MCTRYLLYSKLKTSMPKLYIVAICMGYPVRVLYATYCFHEGYIIYNIYRRINNNKKPIYSFDKSFPNRNSTPLLRKGVLHCTHTHTMFRSIMTSKKKKKAKHKWNLSPGIKRLFTQIIFKNINELNEFATSRLQYLFVCWSVT